MNRNSQIALTLLLCAIPLPSAAATILADDSVAGLGTDIAVEDAGTASRLSLVIADPHGSEAEASLSTGRHGSANVRIAGSETEVAGIYTASLEDDRGTTLATTTFEILPEGFSEERSTITADRATLTPDGRDELSVAVTLRDRFGNPLSDRIVTLISNRTGDHIADITRATDEAGEQRFTVRTREPGTLTLQAADLVSGTMLRDILTTTAHDGQPAVGGHGGGAPSFSSGVPRPAEFSYGRAQPPQQPMGYFPGYPGYPLMGSVLYDPRRSFAAPLYAQVSSEPGLVDHFEIVAPRVLEINEDATIRIIARDRFGNKVDDYAGTVTLTSTDREAYLPLSGTVPFLPQNLGEKILTLGLRFRSPGAPAPGEPEDTTQHVLRAEDSQNPNVGGEATILVRGARGSARTAGAITITSPGEGELLGGTELTIEGTAKPFINLIAYGGIATVEGESDIDGHFAITVNLDPANEKPTFYVTNEFGESRSQEVTARLDSSAPKIEAITFSPEEPVEETRVVMTVTTEEGLPSVTADFNGQTLTLDESGQEPGRYEVVFTAPEGDVYPVEVTAEDEAGNSTTETALLTVALRGLPTVQNLTAEPDRDGVTLQWDPVTSEPIEAYRIYVGDSPTEFDFTLDTGMPTTAAQVAGLLPGSTYSFAVTALQGKRESAEKSNVVTISTLGLRLDVVSQDSALLLNWSSFRTTTPLASFILEYGVDPTKVYTEKRILSGDQRTYVVRDLLNDVRYFLELTPVAVTGEILRDWAAAAEGTPVGSAGFRPTRARAAPGGLLRGSAPPPLHRGAPKTTGVGSATWVWLVLASIAACVLLIWWQRRRQLTAMAGFVREMERQYGTRNDEC